ncbi:hypothetical protein N0V93_004263 [Gnomoniopsis smithogilvyi]|uniref:Uncharacterized protein n=1 Tax=Gnomoniopsis smithogilvyi TaxID=1191159 RepID=A0A9W9CWX4_9PEZI|nr:hypothetical protein N0V93_004263 [Gnomoniopsis smithogilvyi]
MLSVRQSNGTAAKCTPNLLPCRIHHDGPVGATGSYWTPSTASDGKRISHFRGRELHGKTLKVPEGYRGVVVEKKDAPKPAAQSLDEPEVVDLEADDELPVGALETQAEFDEMVIWGHESVAEAVSDPYARGVEEWIQLSSKIHSYDSGEAS